MPSPGSARLTVPGIVPWHLLQPLIPPAPSHSTFFRVHIEAPLTELRSLESWDVIWHMFTFCVWATLRDNNSSLCSARPVLRFDWTTSSKFLYMDVVGKRTGTLLVMLRRIAPLLILHLSDNSFLGGMRCFPTQKPPHYWEIDSCPSGSLVAWCPCLLHVSQLKGSRFMLSLTIVLWIDMERISSRRAGSG